MRTVFFNVILVSLFLGISSFIHAQRHPLKPTKTTESSKKLTPAFEEKSKKTTQENPKNSDTPPPPRVNVRWFGHSFIYLTTTTGVRIALDPYGEASVNYPFPEKLQSDVVLISNESEAYSSAERIFGNPLVFRSITSIGLNRASGFTFKGIQSYKDRERGKRDGSNTIYNFTVDNVRFTHLGALGHPLDSRSREEIGTTDVLFLPAGLKTLVIEEWRRIANELRAKVIVPLSYATSFNANLPLRTLDEYLQGNALTVVPLSTDSFNISQQELPAQPSIYILKYP